MDSSSWSAPDHTHHQAQALHTATGGDDFHQFLDMNNIGDLSGALDFDFHDFAADHNPAHHAGHHAGDHLLHSSAGGDHLDTPMTGTDMSMILSPVDHAMLQQAQQQHRHQQQQQQQQQHHQMPTIATTAPYQNAPTTLIQPSTPSEAIVNTIDAQIQFLQQQKLHAQHQQLQEQQAAFFASQQNHIVPPTPQSLELTAGSSQNYYAQSTPADQHHPGRQQQQQPQQQRQQAIDYRYARIKDQHDVGLENLLVHMNHRVSLTVRDRCPSPRWYHRPLRRWRPISLSILTSPSPVLTLAPLPRQPCMRKMTLWESLTRDSG